jgi:hypothetical protein
MVCFTEWPCPRRSARGPASITTWGQRCRRRRTRPAMPIARAGDRTPAPASPANSVTALLLCPVRRSVGAGVAAEPGHPLAKMWRSRAWTHRVQHPRQFNASGAELEVAVICRSTRSANRSVPGTGRAVHGFLARIVPHRPAAHEAPDRAADHREPFVREGDTDLASPRYAVVGPAGQRGPRPPTASPGRVVRGVLTGQRP